MKIVQYANRGAGITPWDGAPGFYHIALINRDGKTYRSYDKEAPPTFSGYWSSSKARHLTRFRLEFIYDN